jgi:serine/threonine-protein kinase Chk1
MLRHTNVVKFFGQRTQDSTYYLLLEYADGGELFDRIEPDLGMEPGLAHHFFLQLLNGVVSSCALTIYHTTTSC